SECVVGVSQHAWTCPIELHSAHQATTTFNFNLYALSFVCGTRDAPRMSMARALWQGSLTFGLVSIPVEVHRAIRDHRPRFRMLHKKDLSPVRMDRVCIEEGHPVAF